jgi:steroid delta-isomerase-like uncharacterized protein
MHPEAIRKLVADHIAAEDRHDPVAAASYYTEDGYYRIVPFGLRFDGRDAVAAQYGASYAAMPDIEAPADREVVGDDHLVHEGRIVATLTGSFAGQPATGRRIEVPFVAIYEIRDEKIAGETIHFDLAEFCAQGGLDLAAVRAATHAAATR